MKQIKILYNTLEELKKYSVQGFPLEIGGLLVGKYVKATYAIVSNFYPITNIGFQDKTVDYCLNPTEVFKILSKTTFLNTQKKLDFLGIFHSHPLNQSIPSKTDIEYARYKGFYIIYSGLYNSFSAYYSPGEVNLPITSLENTQILVG